MTKTPIFATTLIWALLVWGTCAQKTKILFPEDLGPDTIDVSRYPAEYQETYKKIFLPVFSFLGGAARAINSPIIKKEEWRKEVERIRNRPPCCGACPILSREDAKALWRFLVYDSQIRKTGPRAKVWIDHRRELIERFRKENSK